MVQRLFQAVRKIVYIEAENKIPFSLSVYETEIISKFNF